MRKGILILAVMLAAGVVKAQAAEQIFSPFGTNVVAGTPQYDYIATQSSTSFSTSTANGYSYKTTIQNNGAGNIRIKKGTSTDLLQGIRVGNGTSYTEEKYSGTIYIQSEAGVTPGEVVIERIIQ